MGIKQKYNFFRVELLSFNGSKVFNWKFGRLKICISIEKNRYFFKAKDEIWPHILENLIKKADKVTQQYFPLPKKKNKFPNSEPDSPFH